MARLGWALSLGTADPRAGGQTGETRGEWARKMRDVDASPRVWGATPRLLRVSRYGMTIDLVDRTRGVDALNVT